MKWNEFSPVSWTIAEEEKLIKLMLKRSSTIGCESCDHVKATDSCVGCNIYEIWKFAEKYLIGEHGNLLSISEETVKAWDLWRNK